MRFLINFGFCQSNKLHRFLAAEAVLTTIFERSQLIFGKEVKCLILQKSFPNYTIKNVRTQLIEDIRLSLERLAQSECSKQIKQQIIGIFEPSKGIDWKNTNVEGQQNRSELGKNKNDLYAFYLNSGLLSFLIRLLYMKNKYGKFQSAIGYGHRANYLVGTPGLGKSSKLIAIKHLHDLRIPYIISQKTQIPGAQIQSKFVIHYKIVYIISDYELEKVQETIQKQLVMDFGKLPSQIKKLGKLEYQNSQFYFQQLQNLYRSKGISLKLIIDQVNALYNMLYKNKIRKYQKSIQVFENMQSFSYPPSILVSSKNNYLYHENQLDPIIKISQSSKSNIWFRKFILDSYISAEERLISSVECLLFELEKQGVERNKAIEIIKLVEIGFKTHLNIAGVVKKAAAQLKYNPTKGWTDTLNEQFALQSIDMKTFLDNIRNARETVLAIEFNPREKEPNKLKLQENILFWMNVLLKSLQFTLQVGPADTISVKISLKCDNGWTEIEKQALVFRRDNIQNDNFVSQINFFFSYKNQLYFSYSQAELQVLKSELVKHMDIPLLGKLQLLNKEVIDRFVQVNSGYVFEILVCNFYEQPIRNSFSSFLPISTHIQGIEFQHRITSSKGVVQKFDISKIDFADIIKKLTIPYNYFRTEIRHKSIDFVLSQYQQGKLKLVLVDTTKSIYDMFIVKKTINFKAKLLSDQHFDSLVNDLCSSKEIKELEIVYYVLMPDQTNNSKLYDSNCIEEVEKTFFDAVESLISDLKVCKDQIELQIQKYKTEKVIIQSSIDQKVAKPTQLSENQADAKNQLEQLQKRIQQLETRIKQLEKRTNKLKSKTKLYKESVGAIEKFKENRNVPVTVKVAVGVLDKDFVIKQETKDQKKTEKGTFGIKIKERMAKIKESAKRELRGNKQLD